MKYLAVIGTFCICLILAPLAVAQQYAYKPPLGDIMGKIQLRHIKLWFAGKLKNWELAAYEVDEIKEPRERGRPLSGNSGGVDQQHSRSDHSDRQGRRDKGQCGVHQGLWRSHRRL
jgi:hypothetical protein